ncbi:protein-glutamate O-methyltransferase CheR [Candidatus Bathyarchaeota archaeon]|nr:protein-glutamate O-methyltransferase CheR [Candidatus Bathyarchaeota archaeon]
MNTRREIHMEAQRQAPDLLQNQEKGYDYVKRMILNNLGLDGRYYRDSFFRRKIDQQLKEKGFTSYWDYANFLRKNGEELESLTTSLTVNYTTFFRDQEVFNRLREKVLPELITQSKILRVMSAGCSYGQEPYTLAMILHELLGQRINQSTVSIYAIDIDKTCLAKARSGRYKPNEIEGVREDYLRRYFDEDGDEYTVKETLKRRIHFKYHDLTKGFDYRYLDLIVCRNVFIYFSKDAQAQILTRFHEGMKDNGYLVLGKTEMLPPEMTAKFRHVDPINKIYQKIP